VDIHDVKVYQVGALSATGKCSKVQYTKTIMKTSSNQQQPAATSSNQQQPAATSSNQQQP
jgi:hypothetical protein